MMVVGVGVAVGVGEVPVKKRPKRPPKKSPPPTGPAAGVVWPAMRETLPESPCPAPASCT
jgi:hypothetical protein